MNAPKPLTNAQRIEQLEAQVAILSRQIENVAKFLALGISHGEKFDTLEIIEIWKAVECNFLSI